MTTIAREGWPLVASAIAALQRSGRHPWRTHIQKLLYFAVSWSVVPVKPYKFVIHQFGPYSYGLDRDIAHMEAFGMIEREWGEQGFGSHFSITDQQHAPHSEVLRELAEWLGPKRVKDLEVLATIEFVRSQGSTDVSEDVLRLKPHISRDAVEKAHEELDSKRQVLAGDLG